MDCRLDGDGLARGDSSFVERIKIRASIGADGPDHARKEIGVRSAGCDPGAGGGGYDEIGVMPAIPSELDVAGIDFFNAHLVIGGEGPRGADSDRSALHDG